jgi:hypothetical protein
MRKFLIALVWLSDIAASIAVLAYTKDKQWPGDSLGIFAFICMQLVAGEITMGLVKRGK